MVNDVCVRVSAFDLWHVRCFVWQLYYLPYEEIVSRVKEDLCPLYDRSGKHTETQDVWDARVQKDRARRGVPMGVYLLTHVLSAQEPESEPEPSLEPAPDRVYDYHTSVFNEFVHDLPPVPTREKFVVGVLGDAQHKAALEQDYEFKQLNKDEIEFVRRIWRSMDNVHGNGECTDSEEEGTLEPRMPRGLRGEPPGLISSSEDSDNDNAGNAGAVVRTSTDFGGPKWLWPKNHSDYGGPQWQWPAVWPGKWRRRSLSTLSYREVLRSCGYCLPTHVRPRVRTKLYQAHQLLTWYDCLRRFAPWAGMDMTDLVVHHRETRSPGFRDDRAKELKPVLLSAIDPETDAPFYFTESVERTAAMRNEKLCLSTANPSWFREDSLKPPEDLDQFPPYFPDFTCRAAFVKERDAWYERRTGEALVGTGSQKHTIFNNYCRHFRARHSDGKAPQTRATRDSRMPHAQHTAATAVVPGTPTSGPTVYTFMGTTTAAIRLPLEDGSYTTDWGGCGDERPHVKKAVRARIERGMCVCKAIGRFGYACIICVRAREGPGCPW